jgi:probable F420-dependent oxidoreductase
VKIGVNFPAGPDSLPPTRFARLVESLGFESIWAGEHPVIPARIRGTYPQLVDGDVPEAYKRVADPLICLAQAAAVTERIRLGTGVCLVTERSPLLLAKELASLAVLSGGRVILGAGAGWLREELEVMGTDFASRWRLLRESVEAMRALWRDDPAEYHGQLIDFPPVHSDPKPAAGGIPVLVGAGGPRGLTAAARWGDGWYPFVSSPEELRQGLERLREHCAEAGRDVAELDITALVGVTLAGVDAPLVRSYRDAGAGRVVFALQADGSASGLDSLSPLDADRGAASLERLAEKVLGG